MREVAERSEAGGRDDLSPSRLCRQPPRQRGLCADSAGSFNKGTEKMAKNTDLSLQKQVIYSIYVRSHTEEGTFLSLIHI